MPELGTGCGDKVSDDRTNFMRCGDGPRDLIGITVKPNAMNIWASSLNICCRLQKNIREMTLVPARYVDEVDKVPYICGTIMKTLDLSKPAGFNAPIVKRRDDSVDEETLRCQCNESL